MPRSKTPTVSLEQPQRERRRSATSVVGCCRSGTEGRRQSDLGRAACWLERIEAANDGGHRSVAAKCSAGIRRVVVPQAESLSECVIELEGRRCKVRIQLKSASASYLATLSRELWESASWIVRCSPVQTGWRATAFLRWRWLKNGRAAASGWNSWTAQ